MSDIRDDGRISAMPKASSLVGNEKIPIVTAGGENKHIEATLLFGQSAYKVYANAETDAGRTPLSESDWLLSLKGGDGPIGPDGKDGPQGKSAYQVYADVETAAGRTPLDASDWAKSLAGKTAYDLYADGEKAAGRTPLSQTNWLQSLKGADGKDGSIGVDGKSAYQIYFDTTADNPKKSEADWLLSLKGKDGKDGGVGPIGPDGKTAYQVYAAAETAAGRTPLVEAAWLVSLQGKSAYEVYKANTTDNPKKTEAEWLLSLKGATGAKGVMGTGLYFIGTLNSVEELPSAASYSRGDTFVIGTHFHMNNVTEWTDLGDFGGGQGKSAYDVYAAAAAAHGDPVLSEDDWLKSLQGPPGVGLVIRGELPAITDLPTTNQVLGDTYIIQGYQHVWVGVANSLDNSGWSVVGVQGPQGKSAYQSYRDTTHDNPVKSEADWLLTLIGPIGPDGKQGPIGPQGAGIVVLDTVATEADLQTVPQAPLGHGYLVVDTYWQWNGTRYLNLGKINGKDGTNGTNGTNGTDGKSAFQSYLDTTADNPKKTEPQWLLSLKGKSAYQSYLDTTTDNPKKSEADWLASLKGKDGTNGTDGATGKSAYQSYRDTTSDNPIKTEADWLLTLKGKDGTIGKDGAEGPEGPAGQSVYQLYLALLPEGQEAMSQSDWLNSLRGTGFIFKGTKTAVGQLPANGEVNEAWIIGTDIYISDGAGNWANAGDIRGPQGPDGKQGPEGKIGPIGPDGKSAYDVYVTVETAAGRTPLSASGWLASLRTGAYVIRGEKANAGELPTGAATGDAYYIAGEVHVSDGADHWTNIGPVRGPTGLPGADGKDGEEGPEGKVGPVGPSLYDVYVSTLPQGQTPLSETEWLASLKGTNGRDGIDGVNGTEGKSAYQSYLDTTTDVPPKTEAAWLLTLKGAAGKSAYQSYLDTTTDNPKKSEADWLLTLKGKDGTNGTNGKSAYEVYAANTTDNPVKTTAQWLDSLHGQGISPRGTIADATALAAVTGMQQGWMYYMGTVQWIYGINSSGNPAWLNMGDLRGPQGMAGKSAYEVYVNSVPVGNAPKSEADWLLSLKGNTGDVGPMGAAVTLKGSVANLTALNAIVNPANGDGYFLTEAGVLGDLYVHYATGGWVYQGNFRGPTGLQGPMGPGIAIVGSLANESELATAPAVQKGEGYLIAGEFWGWTGTEYQNMGKVQGPTGPQGPQGKTGPTGPEGPRGLTGPRGSILIMLPRDPQIVDGNVGDAFQNTATNAYYQKTSETNWAYMGTFGGGNVTDANHDGEMKVRLDGNWVKLPVGEAPTSDANALYMRKGSTGAWVKFNRYDLAKVVSTDGSVDCALYNGAEIDGTKTQTIALNNLPAGRIMTVVITVVGKGGNLTWPAALKWSNAEAPTLGTSYTNVVVYWDGSRLTGSVGQSV